jgi:hypothetical protein
MACKPPYKVGTAFNTSPVGSIEAIFPCCTKSPCANGISRKPTGCMSPCGDYDYINNGWQCYSSAIDGGPYNNNIVDLLPPATNYTSDVVLPRCGGHYTNFASFYSTEFDFKDLCCVTLDPQYQNYKGKYVAANSGTYRIKMAKWPRYYTGPSGTPVYIDNPHEIPPPMEEKGYLRTELPPPYSGYCSDRCYCGFTINPNNGSYGCNSSYTESMILTKSPIQFVAVTTVFGNDCSIKVYYGYHEIPINAGDSFVTSYNNLPLEIPSFVWYAGGYGAYDTPAVSLPFMSEMTPENDAGVWHLLIYYNTGRCISNYFLGRGGIVQRACSNGRPMTPAFRRRMIQNKISSRIKKVHYKP